MGSNYIDNGVLCIDTCVSHLFIICALFFQSNLCFTFLDVQIDHHGHFDDTRKCKIFFFLRYGNIFKPKMNLNLCRWFFSLYKTYPFYQAFGLALLISSIIYLRRVDNSVEYVNCALLDELTEAFSLCSQINSWRVAAIVGIIIVNWLNVTLFTVDYTLNIYWYITGSDWYTHNAIPILLCMLYCMWLRSMCSHGMSRYFVGWREKENRCRTHRNNNNKCGGAWRPDQIYKQIRRGKCAIQIA